MQNSLDFYKTQLESHQSKSRDLFKTLSLYSILRLLVFVLTGIGIYFTFKQWQTALAIGILGVAIFLFLLSKYTDLKLERQRYKRLVKINEEEIAIASGNFHERADGLEFQNPKHFYSLDIDLFGIGSFFQFTNRTNIKEGTQRFADSLLANKITNIPKRQEAIKELAEQPEWYQNYWAIAQGVEVEHSAKKIIKWLKDYKPFLSKTWFYITVVFSILSLVIAGLAVTEIIPVGFLGYWLLLGLGVTFKFLKKINELAQNSSKTKKTFRQYALLLNQIETKIFSSELLQEQQQKIQSPGAYIHHLWSANNGDS